MSERCVAGPSGVEELSCCQIERWDDARQGPSFCREGSGGAHVFQTTTPSFGKDTLILIVLAI